MKKYDSYKDSGIEWIGEIPTHWNISKVKFLFDTQKGKNPLKLLDKFEYNTQVYLSMDYLRGEPKQIFYVSNEENVVFTDEGETLLLWDGSNAGEFLKSKKGVLSSTMALIKSQIVNNQFQWYSFKSFESILKDSCNGMGIPHVDGKFLRGAIFLLPPIEEQIAIANYLDQKITQIDDLIAKKERLIQLLEEERIAIINQAVTKGLDPSAPMKDSGIEWLGEIPEHWEVKKLKYVFDNLNSTRVPLSSEERGRMDLRIYDYYGASGVIDQVENYLFDGENILIGEDGANLLTRSKRLAFIASGKYWVNNHAHIIKPKTGNINYFCELLELIDYSIWVTGSAQPKLTQEALMNIQLIDPPIGEQNQIAKHLDETLSQINSIKEKCQQEIELLKEFKTALISEVVTGKVDVRNEKMN